MSKKTSESKIGFFDSLERLKGDSPHIISLEDHTQNDFVSNLTSIDDSVLAAQRKTGSSRIKAGMQAMFENAKAEGYEAGFSEGREAGRLEGIHIGQLEFEAAHRLEIDSFRLALQAFVERANASIESWYQETEEKLSTLAIEIARRAVGDELSITRQSILALTKSALEEVRHGTNVRIRVNPLDASILDSHSEEILNCAAGIQGLEVVPDLQIVGGCEIETDGGVIDARIQSYMARIALEAA